MPNAIRPHNPIDEDLRDEWDILADEIAAADLAAKRVLEADQYDDEQRDEVAPAAVRAAYALDSAHSSLLRERSYAAATNLRLAAHELRVELGCAS